MSKELSPLPENLLRARVLIVGDHPNEEDLKEKRPFTGAAGDELARSLDRAGIDASACHFANVLRIRPEGNRLDKLVNFRKKQPAKDWVSEGGAWWHPSVAGSLATLQAEIDSHQPSLILPLGELSLWATTGRHRIGDWRGSRLSRGTAHVVPTYHPTDILRQWSWRPYVARDLKRAVELLTNDPAPPTYNFRVNSTFEEVHEQLARLYAQVEQSPTLISADIETRRGQIDCIGLGWSAIDALCIPFWSRTRPNHWGEAEELSIVQKLRRLLCHLNARVTGQNFAYDIQYIWRQWGFKPRLALDTMLTHHLLWPGTDKDLNTLSSLYCEHHVFWKHESKEAGEREDDLGRWAYNCRDCVATWEIAEKLLPVVITEGQAEQCVFQHQMWWHALDTMIQGVRTDAATKKELSGELREEIASREAWVEKICGHKLNLRSPKQLKDFFYKDLELPQIKIRTKKGLRVSCNEEALQTIASSTPLVRPLVRRMLEVRSLGVFKSTFVDSKLDTDGRIRCSYNVGGTLTFRLSSQANAFGSGMNLQNVPEGGESEDLELVLPNIRKLFLPDEGMEMFDLDLSNADLRVVAWEADEADLKALLEAGLNPYVEIAKEFYRDPTITKQHPRYRTFKSLAHGTNYLGSAAGMAKRLGLGVRDVERAQQWYLKRFPGIERWQSRLKRELAATRHVPNAFGNRWYCFDRLESGAYRKAAAWIPQSTIALLINRIWHQIRTELPACSILFQVHDSLVGQYPASSAQHFRSQITRIANSTPVPYPSPLTIPCNLKTSTKSWGDCAA